MAARQGSHTAFLPHVHFCSCHLFSSQYDEYIGLIALKVACTTFPVVSQTRKEMKEKRLHVASLQPGMFDGDGFQRTYGSSSESFRSTKSLSRRTRLFIILGVTEEPPPCSHIHDSDWITLLQLTTARIAPMRMNICASACHHRAYFEPFMPLSKKSAGMKNITAMAQVPLMMSRTISRLLSSIASPAMITEYVSTSTQKRLPENVVSFIEN